MSEKTKKSLKIVGPGRNSAKIFTACGFRQTRWQTLEEPGQFLSLYTRDGSKLLPRPISICEIDREKRRIRLVYRVTGKGTGTEAFAGFMQATRLKFLGHLGNGFPLEEAKGKRVFLMGGGDRGFRNTPDSERNWMHRKQQFWATATSLFLNEELKNMQMCL